MAPPPLPHPATLHITRRGLLAQYSPERLLIVAEAQDYGIAKASQPLYEQVGAERAPPAAASSKGSPLQQLASTHLCPPQCSWCLCREVSGMTALASSS